MGRIVVSEFVSVDGVMEDPGGSEGTRHAGWTFRFDRGTDGDGFKLNEVLDAEALLLGRVTYQGFAAAWPTRTMLSMSQDGTALPGAISMVVASSARMGAPCAMKQVLNPLRGQPGSADLYSPPYGWDAGVSGGNQT